MARRRKAEAVAEVEAPVSERYQGLQAFADAAKKFQSFRPAREVLRRVRAVPTIFPQVDHAIKVGGWPIDRVTVIHGPSHHGKTIFSHGLGLSFLQRGHIYAYVDAEMTTPITWMDSLFGEYANANTFIAARPPTYEAIVEDVKRVAENVANLREQKKIPQQTTALFVIDSLRKLVPKYLKEAIDAATKASAEEKKRGVDGMKGAAGRLRAQLNSAWMDQLVPLMHDTGCGIVLIGREMDDATADANDKMWGNDWKLGGGRSVEFDSSLLARIERAGFVWTGKKDEGGIMVGERHRVSIRKTKVSAKENSVTKCYFHTSNGQLFPEGFDTARDVLEMAREFDIVKGAGSWLAWGKKRWQGELNALRSLHEKPELLKELDEQVRAQFKEHTPKEEVVDDD